MVPYRKPRSHWGTFLALGLIAASLVLVAAGWHWLETNRPEFASDPSEREVEPRYYPGGYACDPSAIGRFPNGEGAINTVACQEAREQYRLQANDLIQQRRAANAAASSAFFSYFQSVLSIFGLAFGLLTFGAAGAAAYYARRAAIATETTADVAREIGEAQVRAYVDFEKPVVIPRSHPGGIRWEVSVQIKNSGLSPARNIVIVAGIDRRQIKSIRKIPDIPGGATVNKGICIFTDDEHALASGRKIPFRAAIGVRFQDVFTNGNLRAEEMALLSGSFIPVEGARTKLAVYRRFSSKRAAR